MGRICRECKEKRGMRVYCEDNKGWETCPECGLLTGRTTSNHKAQYAKQDDDAEERKKSICWSAPHFGDDVYDNMVDEERAKENKYIIKGYEEIRDVIFDVGGNRSAFKERDFMWVKAVWKTFVRAGWKTTKNFTGHYKLYYPQVFAFWFFIERGLILYSCKFPLQENIRTTKKKDRRFRSHYNQAFNVVNECKPIQKYLPNPEKIAAVFLDRLMGQLLTNESIDTMTHKILRKVTASIYSKLLSKLKVDNTTVVPAMTACVMVASEHLVRKHNLLQNITQTLLCKITNLSESTLSNRCQSVRNLLHDAAINHALKKRKSNSGSAVTTAEVARPSTK
jgi:hypothetical protein